MAYVVYRGEQRIVSYDYLDREAWHQLRKHAHELHFPCCQSRVILKTSQYGCQRRANLDPLLPIEL